MANSKVLIVESVPVTVIQQSDADFISLTDMVRQSENGSAVIDNWLRNKNTLEFLSVWEEIYNPVFNSLEFEEIKKTAGLNRFTMSVKQWIARTPPSATSSRFPVRAHPGATPPAPPSPTPPAQPRTRQTPTHPITAAPSRPKADPCPASC